MPLIMATRYTEMHAVLQSLEVQMSKAVFSRNLLKLNYMYKFTCLSLLQ